MKNYYEINARQYILDTKDSNMNEQYKFFLKHLKKEGLILDIGFGSGRDMLYFSSLGYKVEGLDSTKEFIDNMKDKFTVFHQQVEDLNITDKYDAIWACASLLHVNRVNLKETIKRCLNALKNDGIMYMSFKEGDKEITIDNRYFNYINEPILKDILDSLNITLIDIMYSLDVRGNDTKWMSVIVKK